MSKGKNNLNTIYISERLQESLRPISHCALTTVTAPMGYGKTTAVNWYLARQSKADGAVIIRISIYSDNLSIFWKSVQHAFAFSGLTVLEDYDCPTDKASSGFLMDTLCYMLLGETPYYIFIDDFHLLGDARVTIFLRDLARRLPENVHLVVASRGTVLPGEAVMQLGGKLCQIAMENLCLNHTELSAYVHRCGMELNDRQIEQLLHTSEGWFSAVYLNLCAFLKYGQLPDSKSDIYEMFASAMIDPLPEERREFLIVMGLADEFTLRMAKYITQNTHTEAIVVALTENNAFVSRLTDHQTFRFHHMMKECAERAFLSLSPQKQIMYRNRYGAWYEAEKMYLHALRFYRESQNYDAVLRVIQSDAGILLASMKPKEVTALLEQCPVDVLKGHPLAILVLMRRMFTWHQVPKMMELKELLMSSILEHPDMTQEERGNLLGECDLIMSFLMYNDISKMSQFHRSASARMSRPAISIRNEGGWTFGSPSVLMMFHRTPGNLEKELQEMNDCMPHYYRITNGHGQGAERIMSAEAAFMQGHFVDAQIRLENTYAHIAENGQENMALCCDFLALRLLLCTELDLCYTISERRSNLRRWHNITWVTLFDSACAYYYALAGQTEEIPELFREHRLSTVNFLAPGRPMMEMIENQVYLAQGAYTKVVGRSEQLLAICENMHYALVALHIRIQTAAACEQLGKRREAREFLRAAVTDALQDQFYLPFAENYGYMPELLEQELRTSEAKTAVFLEKVAEFGKICQRRYACMKKEEAYPEKFADLTEQEKQIIKLVGERLSNKEIADRMFFTEGTVKQYINRIYAKLQITGDVRTKRKELLELLEHDQNVE